MICHLEIEALADFFKRVAEWPMSEVVQKRGCNCLKSPGIVRPILLNDLY
ncbi:hypothetical protein CHELA40_50676 [Chelatococcus asaccharovorans]|nr:hypothetical protein CHELA17_20644 [Chelatococcus asaccharovorans]CAH1693839.1 hypothetical protein CHELA40_50676 [Chelatococcus asaccharovorans]